MPDPTVPIHDPSQSIARREPLDLLRKRRNNISIDAGLYALLLA
jgi:hypothetical protein